MQTLVTVLLLHLTSCHPLSFLPSSNSFSVTLSSPLPSCHSGVTCPTHPEQLPYILSYTLKAPPDFCLKLKGFEAEYHVLHNLKLSSSPRKEPGCLEETVEEVRKQNSELIEQVAACRGAVTRLEAQLQSQLEREAQKDRLIES